MVLLIFGFKKALTLTNPTCYYLEVNSCEILKIGNHVKGIVEERLGMFMNTYLYR